MSRHDPNRTRLVEPERCLYDRVTQSFQVYNGNYPDSKDQIIENLCHGSTAQTAISCILSWAETNCFPSQKSLTNILLAAFETPDIVPGLILLSKLIGKMWLFYSLAKCIWKHHNIIMGSFQANPGIWDFIINEFEIDFQMKYEESMNCYLDRKSGFLYEVLIFFWPSNETNSLTSSILASTVLAFLRDQNTKQADIISSFIGSTFVSEVTQVMAGSMEKLTVPCLKAIYQRNDVFRHISGHPSQLAHKILSFAPNAAKKLIEEAAPNEQQFFAELLAHLHFIDQIYL